MAGLSSIRNNLSKAKKKTGTALGIWLKIRHHYAWHYKYSKVQDDVILFESFHGKTFSDSPLYMLREFLSEPRSKGFKVYYATTYKNLKAHKALAAELGLEHVEFATIGSWRYARLLATAKYLVNNSSFPAFFIRRPEQRYLQTWHGTPLKTLGKQMRLGIESMYNVQHNFLQANVLTFPNEFTRDVLMRDYNLTDLYTGEAALLGYPRNQIFFDAGRASQIRKRFGLEGYETFAYMPTWRGANNYTVDVENYRSEVLGFLEKIDCVMRDDQRMYVNFHSMVASKFGDFEFEHILPFPADADNYEFLNACDVLITDYSSVFFDFSLTRRPIVLFVYDKGEYLAERGMYLDIDELPFPKAHTIDELTGMIETGSYRQAAYADTDYASRYLSHDSPENARSALDLLFGIHPEGVPVQNCSANSHRQWHVFRPCRQKYLADVRTACEAANPERDIILFSKPEFNEDKSRLLHDEYRDACNYVFTTKAYACTALEQLLRNRSPRVMKTIERRERERILPGLDIGAKVITSAYLATPGTSWMVPAGPLPSLKATLADGGGNVTVTVKDAPFELTGIALVCKRSIIAREPLTYAEATSGHIGKAIVQLVAKAPGKLPGETFVVIDGFDRATGRSTAAAVEAANAEAVYDDDKLGAVCRHILRKGSRDTGEDLLVAALYTDSDKLLRVWSGRFGSFLSAFKRAELESIRSRRGRVHLRLALRDGAFIVEDLVLQLRSTVNLLSISLPYRLTHDGEWLRIECEFDPHDYHFQEIYWDAFVVLRWQGFLDTIPIHIPIWKARALRTINQQWLLDDGKLLFTHIMKGTNLSFVYRDYYPRFDNYTLRLKEFAALGAYLLLRPYWNRKRIWLVFEKFSNLAQDNGFYFFEHCMGLPDGKKGHIYYVIDKNAPDYAHVQPYEPQVLDFMSFKHLLYMLAADLYIGSDSKTHLYVWRHKPSFVRNRLSKRKIFFLQHGVTAMKRVDPLFGRRGSSPMTYFLTTSQAEQDIVVKNFGYGINQAPILGFSRWDVLEDRSSREKPTILLMPTWRPWIEEIDDNLFVESDYFKAYSSLIRSPELTAFLDRHDATLRFFIHPKLGGNLQAFAGQGLSNRIELVEQGSEQLNEVMMESALLITDYSSVCWDMLYMDKPIVFFQFDQELYVKEVGSYIDFDEELPGDVCKTIGEVIEALEACVERDFTLADEQRSKADRWFAHKDQSNRRRTYDFIVSKGY